MRVIKVFDDEPITKNAAITRLVNIEHDLKESLELSVQFLHAGGTLTITMTWSIDGKNFVAVAADAAGDVSAIGTATAAWDTFTLPASASQVEITATETNVAACTGVDLFLSVR